MAVKKSYDEVQRTSSPGWSVNRTEDSVGSRNPNNQMGVLNVEDYGYASVKEFKDALAKYTKQVEEHATTINQAAPTPEHPIFYRHEQFDKILSRVAEAQKQATQDQKDQEDRLKKQEAEQKKQEQHEINRRTVGHDDYDYEYARELEYGPLKKQIEYMVENGFVNFQKRQEAIKEKYPKPDDLIT